jgi:hypothetical protein
MNLRSQNVKVACDQTYLSLHPDVVTLECERKYVIVCVTFFGFTETRKYSLNNFIVNALRGNQTLHWKEL